MVRAGWQGVDVVCVSVFCAPGRRRAAVAATWRRC